MKVGLLIDRFRAGRGGAERYLVELAQFLRKHGDEPVLLSMDRAVDFPGSFVSVSVPPLPRGLRERVFAKRVVDAARDLGCDRTLALRHAAAATLYQPHGGTLEGSRRAQILCRRGWRRTIRRLGGLFDLKRSSLAVIEATLLQNAQKIVPVSGVSAREIEALFPETRGKIHTIPLGVDLERFRPDGETVDFSKKFGIPSEAVAVLFVAQDFELKGLDPALRTLQLLRSGGKDYRLLVLGGDRNRIRWRSRAEERKLSSALRFLGEVEDAAPFYRAADLLLHPSYYDPCSRVVLEALACGLPCVTTRCNGASERESSGLKVVENPDDIERLADDVRSLATAKGRKRGSFLRKEDSAEAHFVRVRELLRGSVSLS